MACYGLAVHRYEQNATQHAEVWLRFVKGNPCSDLTIQYLEWLLEKTRLAEKKVLAMIWDHATWHKSRAIRQWGREHNREAKKKQKEFNCCPFFCQRKVPGSIQLNPCGFMQSVK
jgi:hypothetical protein